MRRLLSTRARVGVVIALAALLALPAAVAARPARIASAPRALRLSAQLWATIDVCNPVDQPNTVGIRGAMPGDHKAHDAMYMRFRLQYMDTTAHRWVDLEEGAPAGLVYVGAARSARQAGRSFQLVPVAGKSASILRGVVTFEWRRGSTIAASISRPTTAGHQSLAGADPASYSAATCSIG